MMGNEEVRGGRKREGEEKGREREKKKREKRRKGREARRETQRVGGRQYY